MTPRASSTIWVRGHAGWQGQRNQTAALVIFALLGIVVLGGIATVFADPAPAMKALGASYFAAVGIGAWALVLHVRVRRARVVRAAVDTDGVRFGTTEGLTWPLRLLALVGLAMIGAWLWVVLTVPAERVTTLMLVLTPVVAVAALYGGLRAWFGRSRFSELLLTPDGLVLRIPRNALDLAWGEVVGASLESNRVVVRSTTRGPAGWGVSDLASDPVVLADLVSFYASTPAARAEIGEATLQRLRDGELPATTPVGHAPMTGDRHH